MTTAAALMPWTWGILDFCNVEVISPIVALEMTFIDGVSGKTLLSLADP